MWNLAKAHEKSRGMKIARVGLLVAAGLIMTGAMFAAPPDQEQIERGHKVYDKWCFPCHGTGLGKPGTESLAARGQKPAVLEERTDLTAPMIKQFVRHGVLFMPTFRKTEISDAELDAIVAYLTRNNKP
jgi:mono/diheme cytochrome c family protein